MLADIAIGMIKLSKEGFDGRFGNVSRNDNVPVEEPRVRYKFNINFSRLDLQEALGRDVIFVIFRCNS